jgi:single-stranded-DNA-specific exonuclease
VGYPVLSGLDIAIMRLIMYLPVMDKKVNILRPDMVTVKTVQRALKSSLVLAKVLVNRNIETPEDAFSFMHPSFDSLASPFAIKDMEKAINRVSRALETREKIVIFGDYDVDGVTSTAVILEFLTAAGADVSWYIPHRDNEGYGFQESHIEKEVIPPETGLIITVDCGSSSHDAIDKACKAGIDVVVTDHHTITHELPRAVAVVNPRRPDCPSGLGYLAGVGVAFYFIIGLRQKLREKDFWNSRPEPNLKQMCDLVALGTIADLVPMVAENRVFSKIGLDIIGSGKRPGIKALANACRIKKTVIESDDVAFKMAPRLNAAGRINHAKDALLLLTEENLKQAAQLAESLCEMNTTRKIMENSILEEIRTYLQDHPGRLKMRTIVLYRDSWQQGLLGIVASRLVDLYFRPVVLISGQGSNCRGSARSIPGFDMYKGLESCSSFIQEFGGHKMAAGLSIKADQIERFCHAFEFEAKKRLTSELMIPEVDVDCKLSFSEISAAILDELESVQPFGSDVPEPLFLAENVYVLFAKTVGENHRQMRISQVKQGRDHREGQAINAIQFNINPSEPVPDMYDRVLFRLKWNYWNGKKSPQIIIEDTW